MKIKFIHKFDDGGDRIIDVEQDSFDELLQFYLSDNNKSKGILEIYVKNEKNEFEKVKEVVTGKTDKISI